MPIDSRRFVIHDRAVSEREQSADLYFQRLGWKTSEDWLKYVAPIAFYRGLEFKDYLGVISKQRQPEFVEAVEAVEAGLREKKMEGFWEAIVAQDGLALGQLLDKHADSGDLGVLGSDHAGLFCADFPSDQEDLAYFAAMMLAQALILPQTKRSYSFFSRTRLLYLTVEEYKPLLALLAEQSEAP